MRFRPVHCARIVLSFASPFVRRFWQDAQEQLDAGTAYGRERDADHGSLA